MFYGDLDAAQSIAGIAFALGMGFSELPSEVAVPLILNLHGNAITLSNELRPLEIGRGEGLKTFLTHSWKKDRPFTLAATHRYSSHYILLHQWLQRHGLSNPSDVEIIFLPPPLMPRHLKAGHIDGFCVGEPWNAKTIKDDIGFTAINTQDIWKDHPEKVCAFTEEFAAKNPKTVKAILKALHEASVWLDVMDNRVEQAKLVSAPTYINCPPEALLPRLQGKYDMGDGRKFRDPNYMIFSERNCNYPQLKYGKWWITQLRRWGFTDGAPDYEGVAKQVMRGDIYEEAMKEIGYAHGGASVTKESFFDGSVFDPAGDMEAYAASFAVKTVKG